jgi:hypothetical protein
MVEDFIENDNIDGDAERSGFQRFKAGAIDGAPFAFTPMNTPSAIVASLAKRG